MKEPMSKYAILALFILVAMLSATPLLAQSGDSSSVTKPTTGRTWTLSELDTLSGRKWVWRDPSFKDTIPDLADSTYYLENLPIPKFIEKADYPSKAMKKNAEAAVSVRFLVDSNGKVRVVRILKDSGLSGFGFEEAALKAAMDSKWEPIPGDQRPPAVWVMCRYWFRLPVLETAIPKEIASKSSKAEMRAFRSHLKQLGSKVSGLVVYGNVDEAPESIELRMTPVYPPKAMEEGIEGTVWLNVLIDETGKVRDAKIVRKSDNPEYGFEDAALKAIWQTSWRPALTGGRPVKAWIATETVFRSKGF
jgi:TonB family protein